MASLDWFTAEQHLPSSDQLRATVVLNVELVHVSLVEKCGVSNTSSDSSLDVSFSVTTKRLWFGLCASL